MSASPSHARYTTGNDRLILERMMGRLQDLPRREREAVLAGASFMATCIELVVLTLATYGSPANAKLSDLIPQKVWDDLTERGLIEHGAYFTGEGDCWSTNAGRDYLLELVEAIVE